MASSDPKPVDQIAEDKKPEQKTVLGEDDEFEDFPVDGESDRSAHDRCDPDPKLRPEEKPLTSEIDWPEEQTEAAQSGETKHLWEESWDDDDTTDDFSKQLK
ncbi:hypothetical protein E4U43_000797 [Claviceps pusilla]|uniref:26S proteasome complex subunit SEM1 n=1 Tax=Claviceps pusilla TaxID=123648 RepID=A0A9P7SWG7_9HYPO|nr:hypothetical protein E4U43_000797 [Claviceps pusilla]